MNCKELPVFQKTFCGEALPPPTRWKADIWKTEKD